MLVELVVYPGRDDLGFWELFADILQTFRAGDEVEEDDALFEDTLFQEDLDGLDGGSSRGCECKRRVEKRVSGSQTGGS